MKYTQTLLHSIQHTMSADDNDESKKKRPASSSASSEDDLATIPPTPVAKRQKTTLELRKDVLELVVPDFSDSYTVLHRRALGEIGVGVSVAPNKDQVFHFPDGSRFKIDLVRLDYVVSHPELVSSVNTAPLMKALTAAKDAISPAALGGGGRHAAMISRCIEDAMLYAYALQTGLVNGPTGQMRFDLIHDVCQSASSNCP